jgi:hypothetical protein
VTWPAWRYRDAGFATLPAPPGPSLGVGVAVSFGRWRAGPFRGDDRLELGPQQILIGAQKFEELLEFEELLARAAGRRWAVGTRDLGHYSHLGLRR